jgi:3-deoxy-D-manno-octulosonic-acid transferase
MSEQSFKTHLIRFAYIATTYLLLAPFFLYWVWRALSKPLYRDRLGQRFGFNYPQLAKRSIWIHAVSVGEVQAAIPLVKSFLQEFPQRDVIVTTVTPTGAERVRSLFGNKVHHCYLPYESQGSVRRFFDAVKPSLALIMETELWPNLFHECEVRGVPLILVSARISPKSVSRYQFLLPLFRKALSHGIIIAAQTAADEARFRLLGAEPARTSVMGNIKFDVVCPPDLKADGVALRQQLFGNRPVWVAASTHEGEEEIVLQAHEQLLKVMPDALLVLVPRHPERFPAVRNLIEKRELLFAERSSGKACATNTQVFLGDTMGELLLFYAASDIAFVGGSLVPIGGHNMLEPAMLGLPVITGQHVFNSQDIADLFLADGAAVLVNDANELAEKLQNLLANPVARNAIGAKGEALLQANRGALKRLLNLLEPLVNAAK